MIKERKMQKTEAGGNSDVPVPKNIKDNDDAGPGIISKNKGLFPPRLRCAAIVRDS